MTIINQTTDVVNDHDFAWKRSIRHTSATSSASLLPKLTLTIWKLALGTKRENATAAAVIIRTFHYFIILLLFTFCEEKKGLQLAKIIIIK